MRLPLILIACCLPVSLYAVDAEQALAARKALLSGQYNRAAELFGALVKSDPSWDAGYYGWTRALLEGERSREAYEAADTAAKMAPGTPGAETSQGLVAFRRGELTEADQHFRKVLKADVKYAPALRGLADVLSTVSKFASARLLRKEACKSEPDDPACMFSFDGAAAEGPARLAGLERLLAAYAPDSREARGIRIRMEMWKSLGDRKLNRLVSPYQHYELPLERFLSGQYHELRGFGVKITVNGKAFNVLVDTGASGLSISPRAAKKAGLEGLSEETSEVRGIGDDKAKASAVMLASEVSIGPLSFADVPVEAAGGVADDHDGLMGADFFGKFLVELSFTENKLILDPFTVMPGDRLGDAPAEMPAGFVRAFRRGDHMFLPTLINRKGPFMFLVDSGASVNLVDSDTAKPFTGTFNDGRSGLKGVQGSVKNVSRAHQLDLIFAGFRQDNENVMVTDLDKTADGFGFGLSGILGIPVLGQMSVTLNYVEGTIRLDYHK